MRDFLFTLLAWLLTLPFIIVAVGFAIYNQEIVPITLNPFSNPVPFPVYIPILGAVGFGFVFGTVMTWAAMGRLRHACNQQAKKIKTLEKQINSANSVQPATQNYQLIAPPQKDMT